MKQVLIEKYGTPWDVARCADVPDVGAPAADEVVFDVLAFPINPADIWFCRGSYRLKPPLPATPGAECVGRVTAVGASVKHVKPGDLVINLQRENWAQKRKVKGDDAIPLPAGIDLRQAAMVRINPPTAQLMLSDFVDLKGGDWVIQNVANSGVGNYVMQLAKQRGLRTVNLVRRESAVAATKEQGGDIVLVDGERLADRVKEATGGAAIRLGIDAVGGAATDRLAQCLSEGGTLVNYGMMGGEPCQVAPSSLIFRDITLRGFWLAKWFRDTSLDARRTLYGELTQLVASGALHARIHATYPVDRIQEAVAAANEGERDGKILVTGGAV